MIEGGGGKDPVRSGRVSLGREGPSHWGRPPLSSPLFRPAGRTPPASSTRFESEGPPGRPLQLPKLLRVAFDRRTCCRGVLNRRPVHLQGLGFVPRMDGQEEGDRRVPPRRPARSRTYGGEECSVPTTTGPATSPRIPRLPEGDRPGPRRRSHALRELRAGGCGRRILRGAEGRGVSARRSASGLGISERTDQPGDGRPAPARRRSRDDAMRMPARARPGTRPRPRASPAWSAVRVRLASPARWSARPE